MTMLQKFKRQKATVNTPDVNLDFGAAAAKVARTFEPGDYALRLESARLIQSRENVLIAIELVESDSGGRVATLPLWVAGPNADVGDLCATNQHLIAQLLTLAGLPTSGNVGTLIPQLAGLEFDARLAIAVDNRSGRSHNELAEIFSAADLP
jgi:hypothetical protein